MSSEKLDVRKDVLRESGASALIFGSPGDGKTTLIHSLKQYMDEYWEGENDSVYEHETPVRWEIFAPSSSIQDDYRDYDEFPSFQSCHKHAITDRQSLAKYKLSLDADCEGAICVIDDFLQFDSSQRRWKATMRRLRSMLTEQRHIGAVFLITIHSVRHMNVQDVKTLVDLTKVSVFFKKYGAGQFFEGRMPNRVKGALKNLDTHKYIVVDTEEEVMSDPTDSRDPAPLLEGLGGRLEKHVKRDGSSLQSVSTRDIVAERMEEDSEKLARDLGVSVNTIDVYKSQLRKEKNERKESSFEKVVKLSKEGYTPKEIMEKTELNPNTIFQYQSRARSLDLLPKKKSGLDIVVEMTSKGHSPSEIAEKTDLSFLTVQQYLSRARSGGMIEG
ncbi:hypothetical protein AKJ62_04660 [candidate division MSBL1 archaeon SCGC-AAA259D14]|uniref:Uncharacterized protein n=1 Tax=candidate division MSBL1 archaeon SCGC-AAA259D14 TaxID=1698261 RepID=A0A133U3D2_9EURY|nr:hypothetical protein AKJ62_04660 [candidate division MSBL1 archaeon SCGC-AAA259D14]